VWLSWQVLRTEQLYATLAVIAAAGIGLNVLLAWSEARLVPWRPGRGTRS
jgi:ABC-type nitrate/sulfonate/bicarbonate transport system permease component